MRALAVLVFAVALAAAVPLREQQRSGVLQAQAQGAALDPDTTRSTVELVRSRGFAVEEHTVTTIDGYAWHASAVMCDGALHLLTAMWLTLSCLVTF